MLAATHGRKSDPLKQRQLVAIDQPSYLVCPPACLSNSPAAYTTYLSLAYLPVCLLHCL